MPAKILALITLIMFFLLQGSFISSLPFPFNCFNLLITVLTLLSAVFSLPAALSAAVLFGALLDVHSLSFFGANLISLLGATLITNAALLKFFTNRSLYSFIFLTVIATVSFEFIKLILLAAGNVFTAEPERNFIFGADLILSIGCEILMNVAAVAAAFYAINYFSKKLKAFFILK
ncbi:hypothetical protein COU00_00025 [Candidatus Falkowbacteria bacterium CG10_big_fil_rev_8_21_14_0_10_43_11]|uniref:Rod shape-determining protein MreD n=1 Tax=Candidatus Falkowbacteria bacterium CG10_big_fil_rev_8_21_14_0_10_43_11 TaxID=1974568 RepID=A0A2M6WN78_9BACT|nr:MAG: hypothetical protein COU00_00025 [Candidatus Falkowbacteria bacterium CG10_big_fil_rev_8_21_14_0_10_43_11]